MSAVSLRLSIHVLDQHKLELIMDMYSDPFTVPFETRFGPYLPLVVFVKIVVAPSC